MTFLSVEQLDGRVSSTSGIAIDFVRDWRHLASRLGAGHSTAFQHGYWLGAWYQAFHDLAPLLAVISDVTTGKDIAMVPMISHRGCSSPSAPWRRCMQRAFAVST